MPPRMISRNSCGRPDQISVKRWEQQIRQPAIEPLHRARHNADAGSEEGQPKAEQQRNPQAVDHPRQHVARGFVGAQPVARRGRRRRRPGIPHDAVVAVRDRRPDHPAMRADRGLDGRIAVVGLCRQKRRAECLLRKPLQNRHIKPAAIRQQQRLVVCDHIRCHADHEYHGENQQRHLPAPMRRKRRHATAPKRRRHQPLSASSCALNSSAVPARASASSPARAVSSKVARSAVAWISMIPPAAVRMKFASASAAESSR